jgi:ATP-dependent RNA helicase RhlE
VTFQDFNFNEQLFEGIESMGFTTPTPIQEMAIPAIMQGRDLIACAQTGTGKTGAYLLPTLNHITGTAKHQTSVLILRQPASLPNR